MERFSWQSMGAWEGISNSTWVIMESFSWQSMGAWEGISNCAGERLRGIFTSAWVNQMIFFNRL